jgi:hypothetical protein
VTVQSALRFDGETYEADQDQARLSIQLEKVKALMLSDNAWRTLEEIGAATGIRSVASVSARLRDMRKGIPPRFRVERERVPGGNGLHRYRVLPLSGLDGSCNDSVPAETEFARSSKEQQP